jgi:BirA family biotin operon repressor/biotin-[acetyl-CoA-carboxylase] ligase
MKTTAFQTLRLLADGNFHSGEAMARALGVTRSAVWYGIREISGAGFQVEKVHGRGYRLERAVSLLDAGLIRRDAAVHAAGISLDICDTVDSTNTQLVQAVVSHWRRKRRRQDADGADGSGSPASAAH